MAILYTKIIVLGGIVTEIRHISGHHELEILKPWNNVFIVRNELLNPKYPTLDTKIIVLGGILTEICDFICSGGHHGGHHGGHLEFGTSQPWTFFQG